MAHSSRILLTSSLLLSMQVAACSEPVAGSEGEPTTSGTTGDTDATTTTTGDLPTGTTGMTADTGPSEPTATTSSGSSTTGEDFMPEPEVWDGEKLPWEDFGRWTWIPFADSQCRDGSNAGIWLRYGKGPGLVVSFQGGGACFNALTCANNPANYPDTWYFPWSGIFDDEWTDNPVHDWNFVYIPYCTGDVHAGDRTGVEVPGVEGLQQFVGYRNVTAYLDRIVPTFAAAPNVLVTGTSAGGFGAGIHYDRIARAFPDARVTLLDDSGPPLANDVLAPCLQQQWSDLWGLEDALPAGCDDCAPSTGGGLVNLARYLGEKHPKQNLGLVSSTQDVTIRFFFGYGEDECMPKTINVPAGEFEAGLVDLRDNYVDEPAGVWSTYFVGGSGDHVWTMDGRFSSTYVDGVRFVDWFADLLAGKAGHVGP